MEGKNVKNDLEELFGKLPAFPNVEVSLDVGKLPLEGMTATIDSVINRYSNKVHLKIKGVIEPKKCIKAEDFYEESVKVMNKELSELFSALKNAPKSITFFLVNATTSLNLSYGVLTFGIRRSYSGMFETFKKDLEKYLFSVLGKKIIVEAIATKP